MADDADWVADVKRWVIDQARAKALASAEAHGSTDSHDLGYEAANPQLQSRPWADAQRHQGLNLK